MLAHWIVIIGGLNWGLVGLSGFLGKNLNVINIAVGSMPQFEWAVYVLVGIAAVYKLVVCCKCKA